jgi:cytochrome oxidase Cu insertion factor (SCO1/SenC/PrrC family)
MIMWSMTRSSRTLLGAAFVLLLATAACGEDTATDAPTQNARAPASADESPADESSADAAPDFSFETFEGDDFSLAEQRGTPVVLNFWESW